MRCHPSVSASPSSVMAPKQTEVSEYLQSSVAVHHDGWRHCFYRCKFERRFEAEECKDHEEKCREERYGRNQSVCLGACISSRREEILFLFKAVYLGLQTRPDGKSMPRMTRYAVMHHVAVSDQTALASILLDWYSHTLSTTN